MNQIGCERLILKKWMKKGWDVHPTKLALNWTSSCNRSCFTYTPRKHVRWNFLNDERLPNLDISIVFMLAFDQFLTSEVECLHIHKHWNNHVSHIARWQKVTEINYPRAVFVCPFSVFQWKKKYIVQSVTFVLFGNRVFRIRW